MPVATIWVSLFILPLFAAFSGGRSTAPPDQSKQGNAVSFDGIEIVYSSQGEVEPALVFIHGGFADRSFWADQMKYFSKRHHVVAIDLAGHGESGKNRKEWNIAAFAQDVRAVIEKEKIKKAVLIGNSLGGPVVLETAHLLPGAVTAVIAVDTLQDLAVHVPPSHYRKQAEAFRKDFSGTIKQMLNSLFHPGTYPELRMWSENRLLNNSPEMAVALMESFADFDMVELVKSISIPDRYINGDLYPTQVEKNRGIYADFDAVILPNTGHYPMLNYRNFLFVLAANSTQFSEIFTL